MVYFLCTVFITSGNDKDSIASKATFCFSKSVPCDRLSLFICKPGASVLNLMIISPGTNDGFSMAFLSETEVLEAMIDGTRKPRIEVTNTITPKIFLLRL